MAVRELAARGAGGVVRAGLPGGELGAAGASPGDRAVAVTADVTDADVITNATRIALEAFGRLDVVAANAAR